VGEAASANKLRALAPGLCAIERFIEGTDESANEISSWY
jgi:hypothetical protein